ncbi:MAG: peptidylprolyl isomerase [Dehalococcoidia bacterium]
MAKKKAEKPRHEPTRRQRSRWKQQKRRQRIILGIAILIVVAVLSVVGVGVYKGWYVEDYKPLHETVLEVNGTEFDMEYYTDMLVYITYINGLSLEYVSYMTDTTLETIETNELVFQAAAELGITVSDDEIEEFLESNDTSVEKKYWDIIRGKLVGDKLRDEYFEELVPKYADQRHIMAMFLESEAQANDVIALIEGGESFTDLAAELSLDNVTKEAEGDLGWLPRDILLMKIDSAVLEESAFSAEVGNLNPPIFDATREKSVGYWLVEVISIDDSVDPVEAQVRRMLLGSEQEALDIITMLEDGEDFAELAAEFSLDTTSNTTGGEITVSPEGTTTAFDDYVFGEDVEPGVLSSPIRDTGGSSTGGYWLIEVVDSEEDRELDEDNRLILKNDALNNWVEGLADDPDNVINNYLDEEKKEWAVQYILGG